MGNDVPLTCSFGTSSPRKRGEVDCLLLLPASGEKCVSRELSAAMTSFPLPPLLGREEASGLLDGVSRLEQGFLVKRLADELQAKRQPIA